MTAVLQINANNLVSTTNPSYSAMLQAWELVDDLMGGTAAMKAAATKWLPMEEKEKPEMRTSFRLFP